MQEHWIAERMRDIEVSGIRKVFDLAAKLKDPVNLSIGRSLIDLLDTLNELDAAAVALVLHQQTIDTTTLPGACSSKSRAHSLNSCGAEIGKTGRKFLPL